MGQRAIVLRLAGIYGPKRIPYLNKLQAGEPIPVVEQGWLNLIHVDDAASVVLAAEQIPLKTRLYCVSDGCPVIRGEYYREVAQRIGATPPTFVAPPADSPRKARAAADKRIRNARMLAELDVQLVYPTYRDGLAAILG